PIWSRKLCKAGRPASEPSPARTRSFMKRGADAFGAAATATGAVGVATGARGCDLKSFACDCPGGAEGLSARSAEQVTATTRDARDKARSLLCIVVFIWCWNLAYEKQSGYR